jgi:hypothetical protein
MAALKLLHENRDAILTDARHAFAQSDLGESGETVAQLMCLLAVNTPSFDDDKPDGCRFGDPDSINLMNTPLHEFLCKFFDPKQRPKPERRRSARLVAAELDSNDATRAESNVVDDASISADFATRLLHYFDEKCSEAVIRVTHFRRLDRLPTLAELPFLFDIGAALVLPPRNPGTDIVIIVRLLIDGKYFYSMVAIQVKNVVDSITNASLRLLHDLMTTKTVLRSGVATDDTVNVADEPVDNATSAASDVGDPGVFREPILRIVMKTRMSVAESNYPDACFLKLKSSIKRDHGTGIVRGFPRMLLAQQQSILNEMLRSFDRRAQMPEQVCDAELMQPWFDSMHDAASERQQKLNLMDM